MIDEDLYQLAADELNTDKRRPHIWARACALASDDHDEARYLYTNLRVEELIAEREAADGSSSPAATAAATSEEPLTLAPLDFDEDSPQSISTPSGMDQNADPEVDALTLNSAASDEMPDYEAAQSRNFNENFDSVSDDEKPLDDLELEDDFLDETINLTSELDGTAVFELDKADASDEDDTQADDSREAMLADNSADEELEALLGGVYEAGAPVDAHIDDDGSAMTADFSDVSGAHGVLNDDDLAWLEEDSDTDEDGSTPALSGQLQTDDSDDAGDALTLKDFTETDRLAQELERQASEIDDPADDAAVISEQTNFEENSGTDEEQLALVLDSETTRTASEDPIDTSGLDSIFNSIEHDADEALSRLNESMDSSDIDELPDSPENISGTEADATSNEPDVDSAFHSVNDADASSGFDDAMPAAAMAAAAGAATVASSGTASGTGNASGPLNVPDISAPSATRKTPTEPPALSQTQELPVDLTAERSSGSRYRVFRRDTQTQAVKQGISWPALVLTLPFLIYRHLFGTAVVYSIMWLILAGGLLASGLSWLDAGSAASPAIKASTIGFAILAFIGLLYLPFRHANQWREDKLEQRGFEHVALVRDSSPGKAIAQARKAVKMD